MDAEVDSDWICTQAVVNTDNQSDDEREKINNYGCIVLNDMIDNGRYILKEGDNTIGRHPLNHIYIEHPSISMNHAVIQCDSDGVVLLDKGSLNKTKLNKKILKKDVAYFLEENALLMFGEVRADYFVNERSNEFTNDTKSMVPENTNIHKETQNNGNLSKSSNAAINPKSFRTDIPSSTCKLDKEIPKNITGTECAINNINDIHTKLNSSSPSDEYLLEALSQIEAKQNNVNSNEIFHNLSNKDIPIMNQTESMPEIIRVDTPSPVMNLENSILTSNDAMKNQFQSPNKINTEVLREDTPSPVMDLGCYNDIVNNLETDNYGNISAIQSPNKVDEFDSTQVLEIDNNIEELHTRASNNDNIFLSEPQKVDSCNQSNTPIKNYSNVQSNENLSGFKYINLNAKCSIKSTDNFCSQNDFNNDKHKNIVNTFEADDDDVFRHFIENECKSQQNNLEMLENQDFFNCSTQKISINKNINTKSKLIYLTHDKETQRAPEFKQLNKTNTITSSIYSTNIHEENTQIPKIDDNFFNCPTQKVSINKNIISKPKVSPTIHEEETQIPSELTELNKTTTITSKTYSTNIHEDLTEVPNMDDDFFNCPTQKLSITKKINPQPKLSSSLRDEETQDNLEFSKPIKCNSILSKSVSTSIHGDLTQIPKTDDDIFNCPTQKVSINKNIISKPKVSPSIHEEETQIPSELTQPNKTTTITSKTYSNNIHEDLTEVPDMDDDFFNCPTQKLSINKKINPQLKVSFSLRDEDTQNISEFLKPSKSNSILSKSNITSIHEENTQIPKIDDDFFNCPTQKVSINKNIISKPKVSPTIHKEETQIPSELTELNKTTTITSKIHSTNIHEDLTEVPNMDDDFFNCPTQKLSITKKINPEPKLSSSLHDEETQDILEFLNPSKSNSILSKSNSNSIHEENTQIPKIDDNFFNCPTQKVSINKNIISKPKVSPTIHKEETQIPSELTELNKTTTITSKIHSTNIHEDLTEVPNMDDDFFNCPTQKLSITKKINPEPKLSSSLHDEETQDILEFLNPSKSNSILSKSNSNSIHEENTQIPKIDDDFFNCPTQKVSNNKNIISKPKVSPSIHEEETQIPSELIELNKTTTITSKTYSTNIHEDLTEVPNMDDDFFNCPTQKLSITKKINPEPKLSSSLHDEETQDILEFLNPSKSNSILSKNNSTIVHEENTQIPKIDDDFFNYPTQKVSINKNIISKPKVSPLINEEETQIPSELTQFNKTTTITSKINSTNIHKDLTEVPNMDDDFFNYPTQKLSITKNINLKPKAFSSKCDEETLKLTDHSKPKYIASTSKSIHESLTEVPKMNEDFFNCPTQKLSITKTINPKLEVSSTVHVEETHELFEFPKPIKNVSSLSKSYIISKHDDSDQIPTIDDDFFNCPTQKIPVTKKVNQPNIFATIHEENTQKPAEVTQLNKTNINISKTDSTNKHIDVFSYPNQKVIYNSNSNISIDCRKHESVPTIINEGETQDSMMQSVSKISLPSNMKHDKRNIVNSTTQIVLTKVHSNSISNCSINMNEGVAMNPKHFDGSNNHKQTVESGNEDGCKVQKSKCVKSNTISISNVQISDICNEKSPNNLRIKKPQIRVRKDLHIVSCSGDSSNNSSIILNKSNKNSVFNNMNTTVPLNKNFDSPGCSKSITKKNDLNVSSSTKQKHFTDDSLQSQVSTSLKYNHQMKKLNESIFSPLNIPDVSANSLLEHPSSPKITENNLNTLNCEPSTSSNNAFEWKSFWHKKKVQSQDKGKNDKQKSIKITPEIKENKERYQTRALTRKRKQNSVVESNKKLCNRSKILETLVENSSEVVVSFSYLKSRHLQEMKQFVEKTGGTVTDEITQCSVLVTDKIRCTMKILSAIARGCPIVNANWLKHSYTVKMFQDVDDFIIVDKDAERKYKFQLKESLAKAKAKRLLDGYNVLVTPSVKPGPQEMKVIITCAGGNYVLNWTTTQYSKELIVTCDKDRARWKSAWDNDSAKIIDSDILVTSIIRQKLIM